MAEHRQLTDAWTAELYEIDGWQVVELHPLGDGYADPLGLAEAVWQVVAAWRPPQLVLDMREVTFLSSDLMGMLVRVYKRIAMSRGDFHVCNLSSHATEALHACQLHTIIPLFDSTEAAAKFAS